MNGRHYKLLFIVTMQYALGVPPHLFKGRQKLSPFRIHYQSEIGAGMTFEYEKMSKDKGADEQTRDFIKKNQ